MRDRRRRRAGLVAGLHPREDEETNHSVRKVTNTAPPRAGDAIFARSAWVRHLHPVSATPPDDSPQRFKCQTDAPAELRDTASPRESFGAFDTSLGKCKLLRYFLKSSRAATKCCWCLLCDPPPICLSTQGGLPSFELNVADGQRLYISDAIGRTRPNTVTLIACIRVRFRRLLLLSIA